MKDYTTKSGKTIYFGSNPTDEELEELKNFGIEVIWNLGQELSIEAELESEFAIVIWSSVQDGKAPSIKSFFVEDINRVLAFLANNKKIFIHCLHGRGRTGMAIACLLLLEDGLSTNEALARAIELCGGPTDKDQIDFVTFL